METPEPEPWWTPWAVPDNLVRSLLALLVVVFSGLFVFGRWPGTDVSISEGRAAIVAGVVGTILGYYFGARGVDKAEERATAAAQGEALAKTAVAQAEEDVEEALATPTDPQDLVDHYQRLLAFLDQQADESIKGKVQEFLDRMKRRTP